MGGVGTFLKDAWLLARPYLVRVERSAGPRAACWRR